MFNILIKYKNKLLSYNYGDAIKLIYLRINYVYMRINYKIFLRKVDFSLSFDFFYSVIIKNWIMFYYIFNFFSNYKTVLIPLKPSSFPWSHYVWTFWYIFKWIIRFTHYYKKYMLATLMIWSFTGSLYLVWVD
mgnify:CR=1 FL=1